jgi:DEAD/DEAH box helicase domain-containing protein
LAIHYLLQYRSGYSPSERREIESALFAGRLLGVAATNALELGVDIGGLDVTLHLGFPGSIASLWQQAGRAGRREQACLSIYVGWDGPLDQVSSWNPSEPSQKHWYCRIRAFVH